ncbi:MAG: Gfo/Idh/MocA family oxidoreductase [Gammaproteobacteria bacterium]|nr:Gfo/Idh/MocA family oxidoreductase [Gammaproteobacteria bacterium]MCH9744052.1 Gfo/Idh/MocA family oxidoreductase [Gammaproteobacteria bacterium]
MTNPNKIKTAVIGVGYLGKYHAAKYAGCANAELIAVCDTDLSRCQQIANEHDTQAVHDYHSLIGQVDAVSIAAPTPTHYKLGKFFLENGVHVLMEKPITTSVEEAEELIEIAKQKKLILQVGHLERFNNAIKELNNVLVNPRYIESVRTAPFKLRGSDVNVILDLMIHDIDIIMSVVKSEIKDIRASGASVLSPFIDIANARIEFANGCVAAVTASRVSLKMQRKLSVFQHDCYIGLDLHHKKIQVHRKGPNEMLPGIPEIIREKQMFDRGDPLKDQIEAFVHSVINGQAPIVTGEDGLKALKTAIDITKIVWKANENYPIAEMAT